MLPTKFIIRPYRRIPIRCEMYYMGMELLGKGTVINLSRNGFLVLGDYHVVPGMELVVRLAFSDDEGGPVDIQRAAVRWVRGLFFGAQILRVKPDSSERIGTLVSAHAHRYGALR